MKEQDQNNEAVEQQTKPIANNIKELEIKLQNEVKRANANLFNFQSFHNLYKVQGLMLATDFKNGKQPGLKQIGVTSITTCEQASLFEGKSTFFLDLIFDREKLGKYDGVMSMFIDELTKSLKEYMRANKVEVWLRSNKDGEKESDRVTYTAAISYWGKLRR